MRQHADDAEARAIEVVRAHLVDLLRGSVRQQETFESKDMADGGASAKQFLLNW
jgi:hypothetical protein